MNFQALILYIFLLLNFSCTSLARSYADTSKCSNNKLTGVKFLKLFDAGKSEIPHQILYLSDGNFLICGITNSTAKPDNDLFLYKIDNSGNIIWAFSYGSVKNEAGIPFGVFESSSKDIYLFGATNTTGFTEGLYLKLNAQGQLIWSKTFYNTTTNDLLRCATELPNGNIVIGGSSGIVSNQAAQILCIDSSGTIIWSKSHNRNVEAEHYYDVITFKSALYFLGSTPYGMKGYGSILTKTKLDGSAIFMNYVDYDIYDRASSFVETYDSSAFIIVSSTSNAGNSTFGGVDILISSVDTNCKVLWSKVLGLGKNDLVSEVIRIGKYYYASGSTLSFDNGNSKLFLLKIDVNGNILWSKLYGDSASIYMNNNLYKTLTSNKDSAILFAGQSIGYSNDVIVMKLNSCGETACPNRNFKFDEKTIASSVTAAGFTVGAILPVKNIQVKKGGFLNSVDIKDVCPILKPASCKGIANFSSKNRCVSDSISFLDSSIVKGKYRVSGHQWIFHDGTKKPNVSNCKFKYDAAGKYNVSKIIFLDSPFTCSDTMTKPILVNPMPVFNAGKDTVLCQSDTLKIGQDSIPLHTYKWFPKPNIDADNIAKPSVYCLNSITYFVTVQNSITGCTIADTLNVFVPQKPKLGPDTSFCSNDSLLLNAGQSTGSWDNGSINPIRLIKFSGDYVYSYNIAQCALSDTIRVSSIKVPSFSLGSNRTLCSGIPVQLLPNIDTLNYNSLWSDGYKGFMRFASLPGWYWLRLDTAGCYALDSVFLNRLNNPKANLPSDTILCWGEPFYLNAANVGSKYLWNTGDTTQQLNITQPAVYKLLVYNDCGRDSAEVELGFKSCRCAVFLPDAFTPDGNSINALFIPDLDCNVYDYRLCIYSRWGEKLFETHDPKMGWDGYFNGKLVSEGVYIYLLTGKMFQNGILRLENYKGTFHLLR